MFTDLFFFGYSYSKFSNLIFSTKMPKSAAQKRKIDKQRLQNETEDQRAKRIPKRTNKKQTGFISNATA